jgi:gamma-glutamylcyclotransferase (GGCT)/AIG2-like uncharacterized protein YtfP
MDQLPFFVYGTLRSGFGNHRVVDGLLDGVLDARLPRHQLYSRGLAYVAPAGPGAAVTGELLLVAPACYDQALRRMDRLEGYRPGDPASLYERARCRALARGADGEWREHDAWVYLGGRSFRRDPALAVPSGDWADALAGARR